MPEPISATIGAGLLGAGASIYSANKSAKASAQAAETIARSGSDANAVQWDMYQQSRIDQLPWLRAGQEAVTSLPGMISEGPGKFEDSPFYRMGLDEQNRAIDAGLASRGLYGSGKALKDLSANAVNNMTYNRGQWVNEWLNTKINPALQTAGIGQITANQSGANAINTGNIMGGNLRAIGNAQAQGYINQANAHAQGLQGVGNAFGGMIANWPGRQSTYQPNAYQSSFAGAPSPSAWYDGYKWIG